MGSIPTEQQALPDAAGPSLPCDVGRKALQVHTPVFTIQSFRGLGPYYAGFPVPLSIQEVFLGPCLAEPHTKGIQHWLDGKKHPHKIQEFTSHVGRLEIIKHGCMCACCVLCRNACR